MIPYISMLTPTTHQTLPKISPIVYQSDILSLRRTNSVKFSTGTMSKSVTVQCQIFLA